MKFCKLDVKKATINTILKKTLNEGIVEKIKGRHSYKIIDDNYTIQIIPNQKISNNDVAMNFATSLARRINKYAPDILKVVPKVVDVYSPIQLDVYVNPDFIEQKFQELPIDQRNVTNITFQRDLDFFNGDIALFEQENKNEIEPEGLPSIEPIC